jgi:hypothetical protein
VSIAVVYQAWLPAGQEPIDRFLESYWNHSAGIEHDLLTCPRNEGTDIGLYFDMAKKIDYEYLCFLNSYSQILADDWLFKMHQHLSLADVGIVGATGSWETMDIVGWPSFPNPHIRSTGFMLRRRTLLALWSRAPENKLGCYAFESGPTNITSLARKQGLKALVVGREGSWIWSDWEKSRTFRSNQQENLLIADNKTKEYDYADNLRRESLKVAAWGQNAM